MNVKDAKRYSSSVNGISLSKFKGSSRHNTYKTLSGLTIDMRLNVPGKRP